MDEFEKKLIAWCLRDVHARAVDDNAFLETLIQELDSNEFELFMGFETVAIETGFVLQPETEE